MDILTNGRIIHLITSGSGDIVSINTYGAEFFHAVSPQSLTGKNINGFYANSVDREMYLQRLETKGWIENFEVHFSLGGVVYTCLENAVLKRKTTHGEEEIESVIIDISGFVDSNIQTIKLNLELASVNKKLNDAYSTMAQQEKMASIGELAAGVAHEINNPLGFVMSNSRSLHRYIDAIEKALAQNPLPEEANLAFILEDLAEILKENDEGLTRIARITESLKRFSRMDSENKTEKYRLNEAVLDTLVIAKSHYKYKAEVTTDLKEIPPFPCYGDAVNQVILNLIVNASQAIDGRFKEKKGHIRISTAVDNGFAIITVSDNGGGVPESAAGRVFDPFFTTKEVGKGTGLGLSLCYDIIVNKHNGQIWFENNDHGGADFIFKIPMEQGDGT